MKKTYKNLVKNIKRYFKRNKIKKAVIGLSGGIDSALSLRLVADAIGGENITALLMPEKGLTKRENVDDAVELCKFLRVKYRIIEINPMLERFKNLGIKQNKQSWINLKPRIRMLVMYNYANASNSLVIGTSNKTELALGYFTKYGDGACDIEVIGELYKTEVWSLSKYLNLPERIINKKPSAELYHQHTDEGEIGESYKDIDKMLQGKKKMSRKLKLLIKKNKHKTEKIPIINK
ncbi:MAG: NAD+ synthase [Nanoarchaeota archaeon]|nr:NAD+ synthase [Nanoarchaeota archaeon]